jgi:ABC-2 type transport system ATP-binding protein
MNILEITDLKKTYKDVNAVNGLSVSVEKNSIHGILGPNGAGKSTTINCVLGIVTPDSGKIVFEGNSSLKKWKSNIGYVPQELAIYDEMTAEENVKFFCSLYKFSSSEVKAKVKKALDFVGLTEVKDKRASTFSGGMKRRLNLACAIVHDPKLIIMDEPTVGIDPQSRNRILENIRKLNENGATIVYTTHYMPEVEEICDKITIIDHGSIIASGTKSEILQHLGNDTNLMVEFRTGGDSLKKFVSEISALEDVRSAEISENGVKIVHSESISIMERIISAALSNGLSIVNIRSEEPSLEEIFLTLTGKELRDKA